ncbi:MAG: glycosyltransferase family 4 protein, partial [Solirubrobacteraceae bacterium]
APSRGARRATCYLRSRARGVPAALARGVSPELVATASAMARQDGRGRVIADGPIAAAALIGLARRRPVTYNAHNLESAFRGELESMSARERRELSAFERGVLALFDESWMVSEADIEGARRLCEGARLRYVPNVVDVGAIDPVTPEVSSQRALYVASFAYRPNREALDFLLEDVMPRVWEQLPQARLGVAGAGLERPPCADPRVEILGFVERLRPEYARSSCAVVPLLRGGGTPLKLIEALAHALPVVATDRAASGLQLTSGLDCLLAGNAEELATSLIEVLRDGAPEIAKRGREVAERLYSVQRLSELIAPEGAS